MKTKIKYLLIDRNNVIADNKGMKHLKPNTYDFALINAKPIIIKLAKSLENSSPYVDYDDLISCGMIGLYQAWCNFTPNETTKFSTYSYFRIKGSMVDEIRKNQIHKRNVMDKLKIIEKNNNNHPDEKKITTQEDRNVLYMSNYRNISTTNLEVKDSSINCADSRLLKLEKSHKISKALNRLDKDERDVLKYRYKDELKLKEVGKVLSLSEARIHQIQKAAIHKLKNLLDEDIAS